MITTPDEAVYGGEDALELYVDVLIRERLLRGGIPLSSFIPAA